MTALRLTVAQLLPALEVGGVERGTVEVAGALTARGHRAIVVSAGGRMVAELRACGAEHIELPIGRKSLLTLRHVPGLRRLFADSGVDIVHARSRLPAWIGYLAWRGMAAATRPRFVTTVHGPYSVNRYSAIMARGERVIAISNWIRDYIVTNYPAVDQSKVVVIPRGVDPAQYPHGYQPSPEWLEHWRREQPQTKGRFVVTLPARITRWKGQEDFIAVVARLKAAGEPVHGLIAGGAEPSRERFLDELRQRVAGEGLAGDISFLGQRSDLREVMAVSDAVVSLAREPEAFGRTTVEALALGVPVVGYAHGGTAEILRTVFPQGLVPFGDTAAAAARLAEFRRQRPPVPEHQPFTLSRMLDATLQTYESLLALRQPARSD